MRVMGIDPGLKGAFSILSLDDKLSSRAEVTHYDKLPIMLDELDCRLFYNKIMEFKPDKIVLEKVHGFPGQSSVATFNFGKIFGQIYASARLTEIPIHLVVPQVWQKYAFAGIDKKYGDSKEKALLAASRRWPDHTWILQGKRVPHDGCIDAAFIALYGMFQID